MPAEFARHSQTVICWPARSEIYGSRLAEAQTAHAALANTISGYEPVTMIANPQDLTAARNACAENVDVVTLEIDDAWFRDSGPNYVIENEELIATCWTFNGWGEKFVPFDKDATIATRWAAHAGHKTRKINMVLEGGSLNVDGAGTLITTEQCLLHPNRNPKLSRDQIAERLCSELGQQRVVWLPFGLALDDDTDGHVDNVAAFIGEKTVIMQGCDDKNELDFSRCATNISVAKDAGLIVHEIPVLPYVVTDSVRAAVPYLNFYICNDAVIVPVCGHDADSEMLALLGEFIPDRDIIGLEIGEILSRGGGGIHCITQQIPAI
jgi:agmatine deiminase